jgi:hypothetical protein
MRLLLGLAAFGAFLGVWVLWDVAVVAALRAFSINLSFSTPFHFYRGQERELLAALKGRPKISYLLISGILFFACPFTTGFTAFEYVVSRYIEHSWFGVDYFGVFLGFAIVAIGGILNSSSNWKKSGERSAGSSA